MDINKFIQLRPYLYHLTDKNNLCLILKKRKLLSTKSLIELSGNDTYNVFNLERREGHAQIKINNTIVSIRDQKPISETNLSKCLTNGWTCSDFYDYLNSRVFMWPTIKRLESHYNTYSDENPIILRFSTSEIIELNPHVKFCRLNSGATRSHPKYKGAPPQRGENTFLSANDYGFPAAGVAEATFEQFCNLTREIYISNAPNDVYKIIG
jgi:hypothetical protein